MLSVDTDHDDIRQARVRLVRALKSNDGELHPKKAVEAIGLGTPTFSSAVLEEFVRAGNVHLIVDQKEGGGRPKKRIALRRAC